MIIAMNLPQLYPTPLIEGLLGSQIPTDVPPDENFSGSLTMHPTPLLGGFARRPLDPLFSGSLTHYPTPQVCGFASAAAPSLTFYTDTLVGASSPNTTSTFATAKAITIASADASSSVWFVIVSGLINQSTNTTTPAQARLRNQTTSTTIIPFLGESTASGEWYPFCVAVPVTFGASPGDQTLAVEYANLTGSASVSMRDVTITALKSSGNDTKISDTSVTTTSSTSYATKVQAIAPAAGTYLIMATMGCTGDSTKLPQTQLVVNGSTSPGTYLNFIHNAYKDPTDDLKYLFMKKITLGSGDHVDFQYKSQLGNAISIQDTHLILLDWSRFAHAEAKEDFTSRILTPGAGVYAERNAASTLSATADVGGSTYLVLGNAGFTGPNVGLNKIKGVIDGVVYQEEAVGPSANYHTTYLAHACKAFTAGSKTLEFDILSPNASSITSEYASWYWIRLN